MVEEGSGAYVGPLRPGEETAVRRILTAAGNRFRVVAVRPPKVRRVPVLTYAEFMWQVRRQAGKEGQE